jgi:hypothetical protein
MSVGWTTQASTNLFNYLSSDFRHGVVVGGSTGAAIGAAIINSSYFSSSRAKKAEVIFCECEMEIVKGIVMTACTVAGMIVGVIPAIVMK